MSHEPRAINSRFNISFSISKKTKFLLFENVIHLFFLFPQFRENIWTLSSVICLQFVFELSKFKPVWAGISKQMFFEIGGFHELCLKMLWDVFSNQFEYLGVSIVKNNGISGH